jgi:hypothetical protein
VTTITINSGKTVHETILDSLGAPLPPSALTWAMDAALSGLLSITADATGLNFTCAPGASSTGHNVTVTYTGGGATSTITFAIVLGEVAGVLGSSSP